MPGILVVEDDENLNRGITFSLKKSGYEVFSAESMKKAKRIASDNNNSLCKKHSGPEKERRSQRLWAAICMNCRRPE